MILISRRTKACSIGALYAAAAFAQRNAPPQNIVVDTSPSHVVSSFSPLRSLGAGIDRLRGGTTDKVMTPEFIQKIPSAGWQTVSYRQNTELFGEAWHWNPKGKWSNAAAKEGYFVGDAAPTETIRHSWAAPLPHRGYTRGDGDGYSRLTDGDLNTYWKSNPYLTKPFTGETDHPQWVTVDLGSKLEINAIRVAWAAPYATRYRVQYWTGEHDPFDASGSGTWQTFPLGSVNDGKGGTANLRNSGLFRAVISYNDSEDTRYLLEGQVDEFLEVSEKDGRKAVLSLNITFLDLKKRHTAEKVIFQRDYKVVEPYTGKTPAALAQGMSRAMGKVSRQIILDLQDAVKSR